MDELVLIGLARSLGVGFLALLFLVAFLRWLDHRGAKGPFAKQMEALSANPIGLGLYLGLRFLGGAVLLGCLLS